VQKARFIPTELFSLNFIVRISVYKILSNSFLNN